MKKKSIERKKGIKLLLCVRVNENYVECFFLFWTHEKKNIQNRSNHKIIKKKEEERKCPSSDVIRDIIDESFFLILSQISNPLLLLSVSLSLSSGY